MAENSLFNIIKVREDRIPFTLIQTEKEGSFSVKDANMFPSWLQAGNEDNITFSDLCNGIEPWLTSLFQSEHLSLLTGAGLSTAVQYIASSKVNSAMAEPVLKTVYAEKIKAKAEDVAKRSSRGKANIEDYIRILNELLRGLEVLGHDTVSDIEKKKDYDELKENLFKIITDFADGISELENNIAIASDERRKEAFDYLVSFLMSFASRTGTRERLNIFTTNYDRLVEAGAEIAGLHLLDRFIGSLAPIFRSSRLDIDMHYNPPGIRGEPRYLEGVARFTKLHGSIDWINTGMDIRKIGLPFGSRDIKNFLKSPSLDSPDIGKVMIYPNATKDRETTEYPYVELFRDFAAALCRPNSTLVTYGYGFGDDHINRIIRDMFTIPSTHLVIISYDDVEERIIKKFNEFGHPSQISLIIGNGLADLKTLVNYFLPKPSIDRTSTRMYDLLKQRYSVSKSELQRANSGGYDLL